MSVVENIHAQLDNRHFVASTFVDLKKAFDTVDHDIVIQKLENYGVRGIPEDGFSSYLNNIKQYVSIKSYSYGLSFRFISFPYIYINNLNKYMKHSKSYLRVQLSSNTMHLSWISIVKK